MLVLLPLHFQHIPLDPFEEADLAEPKHHVAEIKWREIPGYLMDVLRGRGQIPSRSANLLHVLGSVTVSLVWGLLLLLLFSTMHCSL